MEVLFQMDISAKGFVQIFVQIGEQCYFERYHSGYLILVKSQCFFIIFHFLCNNSILSVFTRSLLLQNNLIYFSPLLLCALTYNKTIFGSDFLAKSSSMIVYRLYNSLCLCQRTLLNSLLVICLTNMEMTGEDVISMVKKKMLRVLFGIEVCLTLHPAQLLKLWESALGPDGHWLSFKKITKIPPNMCQHLVH